MDFRNDNASYLYVHRLCYRVLWLLEFLKRAKTESGALESHAGWKGLCRKGVTLLIVLVACRLDMTIGTTFIKDATVIGFIVNETISLIENAGLMGIPIPKQLKRGLMC